MIAQFENLFQIAYVTNDIARASALFKDRFGTGAFKVIDTPDSPVRIALAFAGRTMLELIHPLDDTIPLYADWIAGIEGFALRHHHFGLLVETKAELAAIRAAHVNAGTGIPLEGDIPGALDYLYADTAPELGHYLEYIRLDAGGRAMFAGVEGTIFTAD